MLAIEHIINLLPFHLTRFWWIKNLRQWTLMNVKEWITTNEEERRMIMAKEPRWKRNQQSNSTKMEISRGGKGSERLMIAWAFFSPFNRIKSISRFTAMTLCCIFFLFNLVSHYHTFKSFSSSFSLNLSWLRLLEAKVAYSHVFINANFFIKYLHKTKR